MVFLRWRKWALYNGIPSEFILPAKPFHVAENLACLVQQSSSPSPINQAFHSIRWALNIASRSSPTDSDLVRHILGGNKRLSVPIKRNEPINPDLLSKMYDKMFCDKNVYTQRTISACLFAYIGFLRASEWLNIQSCDILFYQSHMSVFIQKK
jgi:hypothetical protein